MPWQGTFGEGRDYGFGSGLWVRDWLVRWCGVIGFLGGVL